MSDPYIPFERAWREVTQAKLIAQQSKKSLSINDKRAFLEAYGEAFGEFYKSFDFSKSLNPKDALSKLDASLEKISVKQKYKMALRRGFQAIMYDCHVRGRAIAYLDPEGQEKESASAHKAFVKKNFSSGNIPHPSEW